ncbi:MAG: polysaccharide deacetylase family protein [Burkholderiales bacterium]
MDTQSDATQFRARAGLLRRAWALRREIAGAVVHWSGLGRAFEIATRANGAIILMYHSVADGDAAAFVEPAMRMSPAEFERQMAFLSHHRSVVPLSVLVEEIAAGRTSPAGTVCITFDDGYLDNLTVAAPILEKYRLPATLYLATRYVEQCEPQWADRLHRALERRTADALSIAEVELDVARLDSAPGRATARRRLHRHLLECGFDERLRLLREMEDQLKPSGRMPRLTLGWDDVRALRRRYPMFEIGGHTRDHADLRKHRGKSALAQIDDCAADLRRELGVAPQHFSFPYERWCRETRNMVAANGWRSAVGSGDAFRIVAESDRYAMPRVESPSSMTELRFKTSGAYPGTLALLGLA